MRGHIVRPYGQKNEGLPESATRATSTSPRRGTGRIRIFTLSAGATAPTNILSREIDLDLSLSRIKRLCAHSAGMLSFVLTWMKLSLSRQIACPPS